MVAGGKVRLLSQHLMENPHPGITEQWVAHILENWEIRGTRTDAFGKQSWCYLAVIPPLGMLVRVAVSMDDGMIITAFPDSTATKHLERGNWAYFDDVYSGLEIRRGTEGPL